MKCANCQKEFIQGDQITFVIYYGLVHIGECEHTIYVNKIRAKDFTVIDEKSILEYLHSF